MERDIEQGLVDYVEREIIPRYNYFDKAHGPDHARKVIENSLQLASHYEVDSDMVYAAAAYHDTGLVDGRDVHHLSSGRIIREDSTLKLFFTQEQIETIAQAAEDHRASAKTPPRSIYGRILAEADRDIVPMKIIRRTIQFGFSHYGDLDKEGHWERTLSHLKEKYGDGGYLHLFIPESPNAERLASLRRMIKDEKSLREIFEKIYSEEKGSSQ